MPQHISLHSGIKLEKSASILGSCNVCLNVFDIFGPACGVKKHFKIQTSFLAKNENAKTMENISYKMDLLGNNRKVY